MVENGDKHVPRIEPVQEASEKPPENQQPFIAGALDLAYTAPERVGTNGSDSLATGAAAGAAFLGSWAKTAALFDGKANAQALANMSEHLHPETVALLDWMKEDPKAVQAFLGDMENVARKSSSA